MARAFVDRLIDGIKAKNNPTVVGLDPKMDYIPASIVEKYFSQCGKNLDACASAILEYNRGLIDHIYDIVPAVKPQLAYYEMYGTAGIRAFDATCEYAREKGMLIIADGKRNDIGTTSEAYAKGFLGKAKVAEGVFETAFGADALTVNPYLGEDGIKPFVNECAAEGKGIFVLVKTSNKSSGQLQDLTLENGKHIYEVVAGLVDEWGNDVVGEYGYSSVGAVVGATYPEQAAALRQIMPKAYILVPGYGAQGGTAKDAAVNFNKDGLGAIVNASRSVICAYKADRWKEQFTPDAYGEAARAEALRMRDDLNSAL